MKKHLALLLACLLCFTLLPGRVLAADGAQRYTKEEAEAQLGISISTGALDFGTLPYNFQEDDVTEQAVTITNTGTSTLYLLSTYTEPEISHLRVGNPLNTTLEPGESYRIRVWPKPSASGSYTTQVRLRAIVDAVPFSGSIDGGWGVGMTGTTVDVAVCSVSWSVAGFDPGAAAGALSVSVSSLDFGNLPLEIASDSRPKQTFTVTNTGPYPFSLEIVHEYDDDASFVGGNLFNVDYDFYLEPGHSTTVTVEAMSAPKAPIELQNSKLVITAEYYKEYGGQTLTAQVELHAKYLYNGTDYRIFDQTDLTYGHIARADGLPFSKWASSEDCFTAGSSMTFYMEPYVPSAAHVVSLCVDGEYVGPLTEYTFTNIQANHTLEAAFAPGPAPSDWAKYDVGAAYVDKIYSLSYAPQGAVYTDPITRLEFCRLAANLCRQLGVKFPDYETISFSDCTDSDVRRLAAMGVVTGVGNGAFNPDGVLSREQAATLLARLSAALGQPMPAQAPTFADNASIASWAYDAVGQVQADGIMGGVGNNTFAPQASYSREQGIVTMYRLFGQLEPDSP